MVKIRAIELRSPIIAAPLAGISGPVYRQTCMDAGAGLAVSEMISDKALHYKNARTFDMCRMFEDEHPVSLQLFGGDPETMAEAAEYLSEHTACDIIDINMGCPVTKVLKAHAGSYLLSYPDLAEAVVAAVVQHTDRPVTVKMRAGSDSSHINAPQLAKRFEQLGVSAIAIHGRTRSQLYRGTCNLDYIRMVKEAVSIPVFGNGDIRTAEDAMRMLEVTGVDGIMIGRGLVGRPYLIQEIQAKQNGQEYTPPTYEERIDLCLKYADRLCDYYGEHTGIRMMRGLCSYYLDGMPFSAKTRAACAMLETGQQLHEVMEQYRTQLREA